MEKEIISCFEVASSYCFRAAKNGEDVDLFTLDILSSAVVDEIDSYPGGLDFLFG